MVALIACAWFALGVRQAHEISRATAIVSAGNVADAAQAREVRALLHDARLLNPDQEPQILLARIAAERRQARLAVALLEAATREEPQNLEAWVWLAHLAGGDPAAFYRAVAVAHQLDPRGG